MLRSTYSSKIPSLGIILTPLLLGIYAFPQRADSQVELDSSQSSLHRLEYPTLQPSTKASCTVEAIAYASAIAALHDARRVADEAYRRWVDCELQGGGNGPRTELTVLQTPPIESFGTKREPPADWSILVDSAPRPVHDPLNPTARTASHQHESLPSR